MVSQKFLAHFRNINKKSWRHLPLFKFPFPQNKGSNRYTFPIEERQGSMLPFENILGGKEIFRGMSA
jgi:hypothetical protein